VSDLITPTFPADWHQDVDGDKLREGRLNNAREKMKKYKVDALLLFRAENIRYITGFRPLWWPHDMLDRNAAFLTRDGDPILYPSSGDTERCKASMPWLKSENIRPMASLNDPGIARNVIKNEFAKVIREAGVDSGRIGVDAATTAMFNALTKELPKGDIVNGDEVIQDARSIKNEEEIKLIRMSCTVSDVGMQTAIDFVKPGVRECEVLAEALRAMYRLGIETTQCSQIVASGEHTAPFYRMATDKLIRYGDFVLIDLGGCYSGYFSDFTRTIIVGKPTEDQKKIWQTVYLSMQALLKALKPGNTNVDVDNAARGVIKEEGYGKYGYHGVLGHGIGLCPLGPPLVGELAATGERIVELKPGMVFSMEPGIYVPGVGGVRLENNILVTKTGCEVLNKTPYDETFL
jgi:Xaa-Pro dipeptidase